MNVAQITVVLVAALSGGSGAYLLWALLAPRLHRARDKAAPPDDDLRAVPKPSAAVQQGTPPGEGGIAGQIAALRNDIATIAGAQIALLNEQAAREGRFLAEMRAVASVTDPDLILRLRRIEALLTDATGASPAGDGDSDSQSAPKPRRTVAADGQLVNMLDHPRAGATRGGAPDDPAFSAR